MRAFRSFDTLQYAKKLEGVGLTSEQAEVHAEAIKNLIDDKLATKDDLYHLEKATKDNFNHLEKATKDNLHHLEERLMAFVNEKINAMEKRTDELSYKLTIRLGGMMMAGIAALGIIIKLF